MSLTEYTGGNIDDKVYIYTDVIKTKINMFFLYSEIYLL